MSTYKGRDLKQHNKWIIDNAEYYTLFFPKTKFRHDVKSLQEAIEAADSLMQHMERQTQPTLIYAVKESHSTVAGTFHPITGFKPAKE